MEEEIICNNCGWTGCSTMLECSEEDFDNPAISAQDPKFNLCPDCQSDDIEDIDDE